MKNLLLLLWVGWLMACSKPKTDPTPTGVSVGFTVNGAYNGTLDYASLGPQPEIRLTFTDPIDPATLATGIQLTAANGQAVPLATTLQSGNTVLTIRPQQALLPFTAYTLVIGTALRGAAGGGLINPLSIRLRTGFDPADKFPRISDDSLLTLVQRQTFRYFYDFAHPVSGMARERTASGETVTTGGTGMGLMALLVGMQRGFIGRAEGLQRVQTVVAFLKNKADRFHGAFPHWLSGTTGKTVPFSPKDDGADLVETAFLMQGLLAARQYFDAPAEAPLRADITALYEAVEWNWFRQPDQKNVLYWHWSPNHNWDVNLPIRGWNECLLVYVLAAGSPTHGIPREVYTEGFAGGGSMRNGNSYYGLSLPLGPPQGGPEKLTLV